MRKHNYARGVVILAWLLSDWTEVQIASCTASTSKITLPEDDDTRCQSVRSLLYYCIVRTILSFLVERGKDSLGVVSLTSIL